ncbi:MAG TPA: rhodanese-like domain-containing protein [Candidatus Sulfotelmatobacter sp.]|nr:rhodanese-like domain-containing protein [Candidatus Sulfotelmatobacter sp.]
MSITEISADALLGMAPADVTILDVGQHAGKAEIRGAVRYRPHDLLRPDHLVLPLAPEKPVVLYDADGRGDLTRKVADRLASSGYGDVRILLNGFAAWTQIDGPTQEASLEQMVPPAEPDEVQALDRRL